MGAINQGKLIRDKTPELYLGGMSGVRPAKSGKEFIHYLKKKIIEEATEVAMENHPGRLREEISDLVNVTDHLIKLLGIPKKTLIKIKRLKDKKRGGFVKRLILIKTKK